MLGAPDFLPERQGLPRTELTPVHADDSGHHLAEIGFDPLLVVGGMRGKIEQDAREIAAVPFQEQARVRELKIPDRIRVEVVKPGHRQGIVDRAKSIQPGYGDEIQPVRGRDGRGGNRAPSNPARFDPVIVGFVAARPHDEALLALYLVPHFRFRPDRERVVAPPFRQVEFEPDSEVGRMTARAPSNLADSAPVAQSVVDRIAEGIGHEAQRIEEIALARSVRPDEERELSRADIAGADALVIPKRDPRQQAAVGHFLAPTVRGRSTAATVHARFQYDVSASSGPSGSGALRDGRGLRSMRRGPEHPTGLSGNRERAKRRLISCRGASPRRRVRGGPSARRIGDSRSRLRPNRCRTEPPP